MKVRVHRICAYVLLSITFNFFISYHLGESDFHLWVQLLSEYYKLFVTNVSFEFSKILLKKKKKNSEVDPQEMMAKAKN